MPPLTLLVLGSPSYPFLKMLDRLPPDTTIVVSDDAEYCAAQAPRADVILSCAFDHKLFHAAFPEAARAKWVHSLSAGVEGMMSEALKASPVPLTNARGAFRRSLAEFALAGALYFAKNIPRLEAQRRNRHWETFTPVELHGATMGIVGYGEIGRACAERATPFGMRILAVRRRPELSAEDPLVTRTYAPRDMAAMLPECDYLVLAAPNAPSTRHLIGAKEIALLKPSAVVINVGRGLTMDEEALARALTENRLRGAVLDVFEREPLPADSPLWGLDNVLISPHCADRTPGWIEGAMEIFLENFEKFASGRPLRNIVDKHAGY